MTGRASGFGVLLLGLSGSGCGGASSSPSSEAPTPPLESMTGSAYAGGTRLRAVLAEASDGTASFFHWWDADLGVTCQFEPVNEPEASFRCLPSSGPVIYEGIDEVFADARCSEQLIGESMLPAGEPRVVRRIATSCWRASDYVQAGARFTGGRVFRETDTGCVPDAATDAPAFFTLDPLPASAFVAARQAGVPGTSGVSVGQLVAEDGSRAPHAFRDAADGFRCWPRRTGEGTRCMPLDFGWGDRGGLYADASCSVAAAVTETGCDGRDAVPYVFTEDTSAAGGVATVHRGGARLWEVFERTGGSCSAANRETVAFVIGQPMELGRFAPASLSQATRSSGLVQTVAEVDEGAVALFAELSASALGGYSCTLAATAGDRVHCVPPMAFSQMEYADPGCTDPIWQSAFESTSVASAPTELPAKLAGHVVLPTVDRVLVGGAPYEGPVYAQRGAECTRVVGVPNARQPYRRFSGEARLSELPVLAIVVR